MQASRIFFFFASVVFLVAASPASAQVCDKIYIGPDFGLWSTGTHWSPEDEPDETHRACIPGNRSVILTELTEGNPRDFHAKSIDVQRDCDENMRGSVLIYKGARLHIYEDSALMGTVEIDQGSSLWIENNMTITGDGGSIEGVRTGASHGPIPPEIIMNNGTLTFGTAIPAPIENSVVMHGELFLRQTCDPQCVSTLFINHGYVIADFDAESDIRIKGDGAVVTASAAGYWMAESGALLRLDAELTGSGTIMLVESAGSQVQIQKESRSVFGPVIIEKGTLTLFESFTTTGNLTMTSVDLSVPKVVLKNSLALNGTIARFGN